MLRRVAIGLALLVATACSGESSQTAPSPSLSPATATSTTPGPIATPTPSAAAPSTPTGPQPAWLARLNSHRLSFGVPAVGENADLSAGDTKHAKYMANLGSVTRVEDPASRHFTESGNAAGATSLVASGFDTQAQFVDAWAASPFQLINMLDSRLTASGFGMVTGNFGTMAAMDVGSRTADPLTDGWPRVWPTGETTIRELAPVNEPDATSGCAEPGETNWFGTPILVDFGTQATVESAEVALSVDGESLETCVRVASDYSDELASGLMVGKVLIIPLDILSKGAAIAGTVTTPAGTATVSFGT